MWPFKKKVIEEPKRYPYRNRYESSNYSVWDGMSIIEKFTMIVLPSCLCFMLYVISGSFISIWWIRLIISIGITTLLLLFIYWIINWISERLL